MGSGRMSRGAGRVSGLAACLLLSAAAHAGTVFHRPPGAPPDPFRGAGPAVVLTDAELSAQSGRQGGDGDRLCVRPDGMRLEAGMNGNYLEAGSTGGNVIGQGAFANAGGITTVIQNSGNQVILQNALIFDLTLK